MAEDTTSNDQTLIDQLRDPSTCRKAFGQVIAIYTEPLYWQIRRMVDNHDDANDLLQNTFIKHGHLSKTFVAMPSYPLGYIK